MDTITIRGEKYTITKVENSGVISEAPGEIVGARLLTSGLGGVARIYDAKERNNKEPLLEITCDEGAQDNEKILPEVKRYEGGLAVILKGSMAEVYIYHQPFDAVRGIFRILKLLEKQFEKQWVHTYQFNLDSAQTNYLINQFPREPKYLYVHTASGTVTMTFDSQNNPSWTLAAKDQFCMPFEAIYLTWTAQATKRLTIYVSNKEIFRSTLA